MEIEERKAESPLNVRGEELALTGQCQGRTAILKKIRFAKKEDFSMSRICSTTCYVLLAILVLTAVPDMANAGLFEEAVAACDKDEYSTAYNIFNKLAEQGNSEAQNCLGIMYFNGQGVTQNYREAFKWYKKAAEQGVPDAQYNIGLMYLKGQGVTQNYVQAFKWCKKVAEQGYSDAQYDIGVMYSKGQGTTQNYTQALKWYKKAAEKGYSDAQNNLGLMYEFGKGVLQNYIQAYIWYNVCAESGYPVAIKNRDRVTSKMTSEQIAQAQKMTREWIARYYSAVK
ncbi:sel1 repeat family protein [Desulforhopalus vacuolatus]|uniref:tetratricopeptide repeat protein n=1 Tax=Desulforhopalus vacuolatus TaxID=40414 RepID=UPI0019643B00|nr:tetratricopeptide repeat protein [Desulforhopalus vacuolatus]MBM9519136.1 sel1 repeat family protein [Desulforhopalus vacuolatus]